MFHQTNIISNIVNNLFSNRPYKIKDETIYFMQEFNENINNYYDIISKYKKIVFRNNYYDFFDTNESMDKIIKYMGCNLLTHKLDSQFNKYVDNLPNNLEEIYFGYNFDKPVDNLPENLIRIYFGNNFNNFVDKLPNKLKELHFGYHFNKLINNLPKSLVKIYFEGYFNQSIDNLPDNIIVISMLSGFNQPINKLPENLECIQFPYLSNFNYEIPLCNKLKHLEIGQHSNIKLKIKINNKLECLICYFKFEDEIFLPTTIKSLTLYYNNQYIIDNLPNSIEELTLGWWWNNLKLDNLPNLVKKIDLERISKNVMLNLNNLPNSVEILKLPNQYNDEILKIPLNLKIIHCNKKYKYIKNFKKIKVLFYENSSILE